MDLFSPEAVLGMDTGRSLKSSGEWQVWKRREEPRGIAGTGPVTWTETEDYGSLSSFSLLSASWHTDPDIKFQSIELGGVQNY